MLLTEHEVISANFGLISILKCLFDGDPPGTRSQ